MGAALHWYDFICPFCYVGQQRNVLLTRSGLELQELAFQAHPEIPPGGIPAGPRDAPIYAALDQEAREAGLPLRWPPRLPNSRRALAAAEWVRRNQPGAFPSLHSALFEAHFVLGEDLGSPAVIERHASSAGVDLAGLRAALISGRAMGLVAEAEMSGREVGVQGTPAWLLGGRLVMGLRPAAEFQRLAEQALHVPT
jgi:predicted DsbA family dithiol-disulfide isomerase